MITTIFFDVGGTLIHPNMTRLMAPLLEHACPGEHHLAAAERAAKQTYRCEGNGNAESAAEADQADGHGPVNRSYWRIYFEALLEELGCCQELLPELTSRAGDSSNWNLTDPSAALTLRELKRQYRMAVISNADGHIDRVLRQAGLDGFFETLVDSGCVGYEKPDPRIFCSALQQMQASPEQSLYVGDIYAIDYQGARNAGMQAVLLDPNGVYRDWAVDRIASLTELPNWAGSK
jgi:HAD superfamily hydrolase (TIGR01509 family)